MSKPNARYDWIRYMPRMMELYDRGWSIPKIHAEIQDPENGFTPSQRMVYDKFKSEGYSTNSARSSLLHLHPVTITTGRTTTVAGNLCSRTTQVPTIPPTAILRSTRSPQHGYPSNNYDYNVQQRQISHAGGVPNHFPIDGSNIGHTINDFGFLMNPWDSSQPQNVRDSGPVATNYVSMPCSDMPLDSEHTNQHVNADPWVAKIPCSTSNIPPMNSGMMAFPEADTSRWSMETEVDIGSEFVSSSFRQSECQNHVSTTNQKRQYNSLDTTSLPDRSSKRNLSPAESVTARPVSWVTSKRGFNRSVSPDNRLSTGSPRDSGYASGRSSLLVPIAEDTPPHPESLAEFNGLCRVACHGLHEPQYLQSSNKLRTNDIFKNTPTCDHCQYSGIHNLSWSAQRLPLNEFLGELRREGLYDFTAVDAAGNSALHYAAAGGASYEHFLALIEAGINPYLINTSGQLFLNCIWAGSGSACDTSVTLFTFELVNLLNLLEPKGAVAALRWRDNEGRTVLDSIAAQMPCQVTTQTFQLVKDAGYPLEMSQQFSVGQPLHRISSLQQPPPQLNEEMSARNSEGRFSMNQSRQQRAYEIYGRATDEPSYVDLETGDNILHALACLRLPEKGTVLSKIRKFISKDVELNVHNRRKDTPLTSFIKERPFSGVESDESGATMSKYLDTLLWKDSRRRIPNKINVNLKNREGATALYLAAVRARPDSVRSLIEAGANVNSRIAIGGQHISILQATRNAKAEMATDKLKVHLFDNVISYLEHDGAVSEPTAMDERRLCDNSVTIMPI